MASLRVPFGQMQLRVPFAVQVIPGFFFVLFMFPQLIFFCSTSSASGAYPGGDHATGNPFGDYLCCKEIAWSREAFDIRSAPTSHMVRPCSFLFERLTSCSGICTSQCRKRLFQVFDPILCLVQLDTHCSNGRGNVLERSREVHCLLELLY